MAITCGFHCAECGLNWFPHPHWDLTFQEHDLAESQLALTSAEWDPEGSSSVCHLRLEIRDLQQNHFSHQVIVSNFLASFRMWENVHTMKQHSTSPTIPQWTWDPETCHNFLVFQARDFRGTVGTLLRWKAAQQQLFMGHMAPAPAAAMRWILMECWAQIGRFYSDSANFKPPGKRGSEGVLGKVILWLQQWGWCSKFPEVEVDMHPSWVHQTSPVFRSGTSLHPLEPCAHEKSQWDRKHITRRQLICLELVILCYILMKISSALSKATSENVWSADGKKTLWSAAGSPQSSRCLVILRTSSRVSVTVLFLGALPFQFSAPRSWP